MSSETCLPPVMGRCGVCGCAPVEYLEIDEPFAFERVLFTGALGSLSISAINPFDEIEVIRGERIRITSPSRS